MAKRLIGPGILVLGSSNTDLLLTCSRLPCPGETVLGGQFQRLPGGKGANQAVAASRAGGRVALLGACGLDDFGRAARKALRNEKINLRFFRRLPGVPSGIALILLGGPSKENLIGVAQSANDALTAGDIVAAEKQFPRSDVVLAQLEIPLSAVRKAAVLARTYQVPFVLNPAPAVVLPSVLLRMIHTLIPNEHEACLMTGEREVLRAGKKLLHLGCRNVVITLGAKGALLLNHEGIRQFAVPRVRPVDTVGAGDCFCGWYVVGLASGLRIEENIQRALQAASISVTRPGAQAAMPYRREIDSLL